MSELGVLTHCVCRPRDCGDIIRALLDCCPGCSIAHFRHGVLSIAAETDLIIACRGLSAILMSSGISPFGAAVRASDANSVYR